MIIIAEEITIVIAAIIIIIIIFAIVIEWLNGKIKKEYLSQKLVKKIVLYN